MVVRFERPQLHALGILRGSTAEWTTPRVVMDEYRLWSSLRQESAQSIQIGQRTSDSAKDDGCGCRRDTQTCWELSALRHTERSLFQTWNGGWGPSSPYELLDTDPPQKVASRSIQRRVFFFESRKNSLPHCI